MRKHGVFPKENAAWRERLPCDLWTGVPHDICLAECAARQNKSEIALIWENAMTV
jgi:hypothetical protein